VVCGDNDLLPPGRPAVADGNLYSADLVHATTRGHVAIAAAAVRPPASRIPAAEFSTGAEMRVAAVIPMAQHRNHDDSAGSPP
jgi:hypothetical protein